LDNKIFEDKNFESLQIKKKLKILRNFVDIDEKIKFGYLSVIPKSSLLHINENKFLSFQEIKKEMKKKELERNQKFKGSISRNYKNLTPFQNFELTKNILKEKIKFKKDNNCNQKSILRNIFEGTETGHDKVNIGKQIFFIYNF